MNITYLVHDLADPAVARRVTMLRRAGATVDLLGFRRTAEAPAQVAGAPVWDLGQTQDGRFVARILSVLQARRDVKGWGEVFRRGDVILARNLEMLYLAAAARRRFAPDKPLTYELLDIHRLMIGTRLPNRLLRGLEAHLLRQCDSVIVSSPAFERDYLRQAHQDLPQVHLWENKVMPSTEAQRGDGAAGSIAVPPPPVAGKPWRIGWFGAIRCRRSLLCLADIARRYPGLIEVDIRGRITDAMGPDFAEIVAATPGLRYHGPYRYPDDLPAIYGAVHFVWAIDFYEAGFNSTWLLPNRLYEGGYCRRVPIALASVETGRWLAQHQLGFLLDDQLEEAAAHLLTQMNPERYEAALSRSQQASPDLFYLSDAACDAMVAALRR